MKTLLKVLTFPIWFPVKLLWYISKVLAFIFMFIIVIIVLIFIFL